MHFSIFKIRFSYTQIFRLMPRKERAGIILLIPIIWRYHWHGF